VKREFDCTPACIAPGKLKFADGVVPLHPPFLSDSKVYTIIYRFTVQDRFQVFFGNKNSFDISASAFDRLLQHSKYHHFL